jgi:prepilin-type processing-associated H-X9-DG protein
VQAFTIIEVVVSMGVIGLLVAILIPAVLSARQVSRRVLCQNNLKQLVLAARNYESAHTVFPAWNGSIGETGYTRLFPFMEVVIQDPAAAFLAKHRVGGIQCPDDYLLASRPIEYSYAISAGPEPQDIRQHGGMLERPYSGGQDGAIRQRDIIDGLSNTVYFSERVGYRTPESLADALANPLEDVHSIEATVPPLNTHQDATNWMVQFGTLCIEGNSTPFWLAPTGLPGPSSFGWYQGLVTTGIYTHWFPPNTKRCVIEFDFSSPWSAFRAGAQSHHAGGVNASFADGRVKFVSQSIDRSVWQSVGSIAGDEISIDH